MKNLLTYLGSLMLCVLTGQLLMAQAPEGIHYQAILRDAQGAIMANEALTTNFQIRQGSANGNSVYAESHSLQTNELGLLTAVVGSGTSTDNFSNIDWSAGPYFLATEIDQGSGLIDLGTTQLLSVPYALFAESVANTDDADADPSNELQDLSLNGSTLEISSGNSVDLGPAINDADADPTNELQDLSLNGTTLRISDGDSTDLGSLVDDADADPSNELQDLSLNGTTLDISNGTGANLSSLVDDADADPNNELQDLSLNGTTLNISNGSGADLSSLVDDADADPANELQSVSLSGTNLSITNGNTINLQSLVNDADANPTNEIQVLNFSNNNLSISNGNSVNLSSLEGTLADFGFAAGTGATPNANTQFLVSPVSIPVTSSDQKILVISNALLGNNNLINGGDGLDLSIGFRFTGTSGLNTTSPAMTNVKIGPNQRQVFGLSVMLTNLIPGTYDFGLAGDDDGNGNWNSNGAGYTTVLIFN